MSDTENIELTYHEFPSRMEYRLGGKFHRLDGPAIEYGHGLKMWFFQGREHREGGPAKEYSEGTKEWWYHGKRHRLDGPAVINNEGDEQWWVNDKLHRLDGPATRYPDEGDFWWLNNENVTKEQVEQFRLKLLLKSFVLNPRSFKFF